MKQRVVITGMGVVTPIGIGKEAFWEALLVGKSGITKITRFDASDYPTQIGGEVKDFDPTAYIDKKEARRMDRVTQFALASATMAIKDSGLNLKRKMGTESVR